MIEYLYIAFMGEKLWIKESMIACLESTEIICCRFCGFMVRKNDYTLCRDDIHYMSEIANEAFSELFEAFLYAAYEDFKKNHIKPKNLTIIIGDED